MLAMTNLLNRARDNLLTKHAKLYLESDSVKNDTYKANFSLLQGTLYAINQISKFNNFLTRGCYNQQLPPKEYL